MIFDFPKWWQFLTHYGFNYHANFIDALKMFSEERTKVVKEEAGTRDLNQAYDKFQANQYKVQKRKIMDLARRKVHGRIN